MNKNTNRRFKVSFTSRKLRSNPEKNVTGSYEAISQGKNTDKKPCTVKVGERLQGREGGSRGWGEQDKKNSYPCTPRNIYILIFATFLRN